MLPTCPFSEELVSPTTDGLLTDHLQMSAPDRDYVSCRETLNPRSCLCTGGPHPRIVVVLMPGHLDPTQNN